MLRRRLIVNLGFTLLWWGCQSPSSNIATGSHVQPCDSKIREIRVRGRVALRDGTQGPPYPGATVSLVRSGANEAAVVVTSDSRGRFSACVPPGNYAVTATAPDRMPFYQAPQVIPSSSELHATLSAGGVELSGMIVHESPIPPRTYVRLTRISDDTGDIFYAPVHGNGRFSVRVFAGFDYRVDVVGELVSVATNVSMASDARVTVPAFSRAFVESPPESRVLSWIRRAAMPLRPNEPIGDTDDWRALQSIIGDARVVGLGENTHGAGSFAEVRNRLVQAAVTHLGFSVFAIEANFTEALAINDYVLTGQGDPNKALARLHFWISDSEQTSDLIAWMRQYNADPMHKRKIKFYGVDMQYSRAPFQSLVEYLERVDPTSADEMKTRLGPLNSEDGSRLAQLSAAQKRSVCNSAVAQIGALDANRSLYVRKAGKERWRMARQNTVVLSQACNLSVESLNGNDPRDKAMAENVQWILDTEGDDTRVLLWAHNGHISTSATGSRPLGRYLREALGRSYVAIGEFFDRGSFRAWDMRENEPDKQRVIPIDVPSAPTGYLEAAFAKVALPVWAIDLKRAPRTGDVWKWLSTPHPSREIGSLYLNEESSKTLFAIVEHFDAFIFVGQVTPTKPNPTGLRGPASR